MLTPIKLSFGKHVPDAPAFQNPGSPYLKNVIPSRGFWRPFADLSAYSDALTARAQGGISGRDTSGNVYTFTGDATKLYKLSTDTWSDVSRLAGGAYATPSGGAWEFIPWSDDILIAVNGVDAPQKIDPQTGTNFTALGGSPPAASHGAIVRSFVFLGNWTANENRVAWSAIDNAEEWNTDGTNQSDQEFLASGGPIMRIFGGEVGLVFSQSSIHRFTYVGSPVVFQKDEIAPGIGLLASGAASQWGNLIFFLGPNSFYRMDAFGVPQPIGESRWSKTFFSELDQNFTDRISSAIDPINTIWMVVYATAGAVNGVPNRAFLYNWITDDCSFVDVTCEYVLSSYTTGITLDNLQTETGYDLDSLPFSLDSSVWQGGRLILGAFTSAHKLGFFSGSALEAEIDTAERDNDGRRLFIAGARPICDASDAEIAIAARERQSDSASLGAYSSVGADGLCPQHLEGRFMRARLRIPAGSSWSKAQGVEAYVAPAGEI